MTLGAFSNRRFIFVRADGLAYVVLESVTCLMPAALEITLSSTLQQLSMMFGDI